MAHLDHLTLDSSSPRRPGRTSPPTSFLVESACLACTAGAAVTVGVIAHSCAPAEYSRYLSLLLSTLAVVGGASTCAPAFASASSPAPSSGEARPPGLVRTDRALLVRWRGALPLLLAS